jgi:hypothetical protein
MPKTKQQNGFSRFTRQTRSRENGTVLLARSSSRAVLLASVSALALVMGGSPVRALPFASAGGAGSASAAAAAALLSKADIGALGEDTL